MELDLAEVDLVDEEDEEQVARERGRGEEGGVVEAAEFGMAALVVVEEVVERESSERRLPGDPGGDSWCWCKLKSNPIWVL